MTERGERHVERSSEHFKIGPSQLSWDGVALHIDIDEVTVPIPRKIKGRVSVYPDRLFNFSTPLDPLGRHHWGPLAPSARVEVKLNQPSQNWQGHGYLDSNEGVEPIEVPFKEWDWSRSLLGDGSVAVMYDVQYKQGADQLLALKFHPDGQVTSFDAPSRITMKKTAWWLPRRMRSESSVNVAAQLEDTPFYQRAILESQLLGETVTSFHETLNVPRLVSPVVQGMLPWRMPRRP
jgi:carotenoid 1,2-hydratase